MHLVQILLPLRDNGGEPFPAALFRTVQAELTERFGGATAFTRSPAEGFWREGDAPPDRDEVVLFEAMDSELDEGWWRGYRRELERRFRQDTVLVRALAVQVI